MRKLTNLVVVCSLTALCAQAQPAATGWAGCQLTVDLRDGSRVVGKSLEDSLSFHSAMLGDMKLAWTAIRSIEYASTNTGTARLTATNGDALLVQLAAGALRVETAFGQTDLPVKLIRSVKVSKEGRTGQRPAGLLTWWTGDGNAKDNTGEFDGKVSGMLTYVPGPSGQAFQFNGGATQVDFGKSAGNFGTNDFTIAFRMKTVSQYPYEALLGKRPTCDGAFSHWNILYANERGTPPAGFLHFGMGEGGTAQPSENALISSRPINDGQWHHIAWVRQSGPSGECRGLSYVDGALDNAMSYRNAIDLANDAPLLLGRNVCECCDGSRPYSGAVADLRIYGQALSPEEILAICQAVDAER